MSWIILAASGLMEAVWATALSRSEGFHRPVPSIVFALALVASMSGLGWAMRDLPVGTAYAVWTGIGAAVTVIFAMVTGAEAASLAKIVFLAMIVAGIVGLKVIE